VQLKGYMPTAESVVRPHEPTRNTTDRRVHARAPLEAPVLLDAMSEWQRARSHDVSVGGLAVACESPLPVGKTVEVYFELPNGIAVEGTAEVVRASGTVIGLKFKSLDRRAMLALRSHCRATSAVA
jgi:PilZ domain